MTVYERMRADLRTAMKARDTATIAALRTLIAAIDNAQAVPLDEAAAPSVGKTNDVSRRVLSEKEVHAILRQRSRGAPRRLLSSTSVLVAAAEAAPLRIEIEIIETY